MDNLDNNNVLATGGGTPLEQAAGSGGANSDGNQFGQFKNAESLFLGYKNLLSEFTKRTQKLKDTEARLMQFESRNNWQDRIADLETRYPTAASHRDEITSYIKANPSILKEKDCLEKALLHIVMTNGHSTENNEVTKGNTTENTTAMGASAGKTTVAVTAAESTEAESNATSNTKELAFEHDKEILTGDTQRATTETTTPQQVGTKAQGLPLYVSVGSFKTTIPSLGTPDVTTQAATQVAAPQKPTVPPILGGTGTVPQGGYVKPTSIAEASKLASEIFTKKI